jgi:SAM-dependent methyltransferase
MTDQATLPFDRDHATRIARAFLPPRWYGNRYDYYYTQAKLRTDPLYPGALAALRGCDAPLLDLGCGLGLFAHALRADGQAMPYLGVDIDADKIARARTIAARAGVAQARFEVLDLGQGLPEHAGSVAILDVLQYLSLERQRELLQRVAGMLTPSARLVIRTGLGDESRRGRTTRITDRLAHTFGWMQEVPKQYPTRAGLLSELEAAGLAPSFKPLYGNTPFNNWLVVAQRSAV